MCSSNIRTFIVVHVILDIVFIIAVLWIFYKYIMYQKIEKMPRLLNFIGFLFYIFSLLSFVSGIPAAFNLCATSKTTLEYLIPFYIYVISYGGQWQFLFGLLFCRVYFIFGDTLYKIKKAAIIAYIILYSMYTIIHIYYLITLNDAILLILGPLAFLTAFYISILFIYKLYKVNHDDNKNNQSSAHNVHNALLPMITKCAILAIFSLLTTFCIIPFTLIIGSIFGFLSDVTRIFFNTLELLDIFTNFICISLSYKFNEKYYVFLCGWLDARCRICGDKSHKTAMETQMSSNLFSVEPASKSSSELSKTDVSI